MDGIKNGRTETQERQVGKKGELQSMMPNGHKEWKN